MPFPVDIEASGAVVWDPIRKLTLLVHRPRYNDWSLPKGKAESGEASAETALREVQEETGCSGELLTYLGEAIYEVKDLGVPKTKRVQYWFLKFDRLTRRAEDLEIDEIRWVTLPEGKNLATYERDVHVLCLAEDFLGASV